MANVVCMVDNVYQLLIDSTSLLNWSDTSSLENNVFKFAIDEDDIETYPQVLVHNDSNVVNFVSDKGFEWLNSVMFEFTDTPVNYFNEDDTRMTKIGDILRAFQLKVDSVIAELICNPNIAYMPIKQLKLVDLGIASSELSGKETGRLLKSMYVVEFWG